MYRVITIFTIVRTLVLLETSEVRTPPRIPSPGFSTLYFVDMMRRRLTVRVAYTIGRPKCKNS